MKFTELGLSKPVTDALAAKGYETPTPIQAQAIPALLQGRDLLGIAQTGTGKTAAFTLPSIDHLVASGKRAMPRQCRMLVLAPTRELAAQIADNARGYSKFAKLSVVTVFGGTSVHKNKVDLSKGCDILVATPGRLLDLIDEGHLSLSAVEIFVLDEADQMMDLGFIHALKRVVKILPRQRQSLFFSATMPSAIRDLSSQFIKDPVEVKVTPVATTAERVEQQVIFVNQSEKQALLTMALGQMKIDRALVFTRTKHGADRVVKLLAANDIASNAIHGNKSQPQRERALAAFRSGEVPILVATDIAARGIDVSGVSHVFNFELPNVPEQYVHRIGRTARAGADGIAVSFCADDERPYLRDIEKLTRQKVTVRSLPDNFLEEAARLVKARKPVPMSRDEQNGRNGRAQQGGGGGRGGRSGAPAEGGERRFFPAKKRFSAKPAGGGSGGGQRRAGGGGGGGGGGAARGR